MHRVYSVVLVFAILNLAVAQTIAFKPPQNPSTGTITDLTFDGVNRVYLVTTQGLYWTTDEGTSWSHPDSVLVGGPITCVVRVSSYIIFAGTAESGLYESIDSGRNWKRVNIDGIAANQINTLLFSPIIGLCLESESGLCWSGDTGKNWQTPTLAGEWSYGSIMSLSSNTEGYLLASSMSPDRLYTYVCISADSGKHWSMLFVGGPHEFTRMNRFSQGKFNVADDTLLYVLSDDRDGMSGKWYTGLQLASIHNSAVPRTVFFASKDTTSYSDSFNTPIKRDFTLNQNGVVYLIYDDTISFLNSQSAWSFVGRAAASRIVIDGNGIVFCLGDSGVMISDRATQVMANKSENPVAFQLPQNYPNPFNPSTTIRFSIPERSRVRITIFNLLGQQVAELANEEMGSGNFERTWNANVASGLYFYRLEAISISNPGNRFVDVKKMILLR